MIYLTMLLIPTVVCLGFFLFSGKKVTFQEFLLQNVLQLVVMGAFIGIANWHNTSDVEVWNGRVAEKRTYHVSCSHSYTCNCYTTCSGSGKSRSCFTHCSTCYEHSYDVNWDMLTTNGDAVYIDRVDRRGIVEPSRWSQIKIGEPAAVTHSFTNYIKAAPNSLFRKQGLVEQYKDKLPEYPVSIYDYYHLDRFITIGFSVADGWLWNKNIEELNAEIGSMKEVNVIVVFSKNMPEDYFYAVEQNWIGGKKNDFVLVANVDDSGNITWSKAMAWTNNKMAETVVADQVMKIGKIDRTAILGAIKDGVSQYFVRKEMKDFEYLAHRFTPTTGEWIFSMILGLTISVGLGIFFIKNEVEILNYNKGKKNEYRY